MMPFHSRSRWSGLGDLVYSFANPVARFIDRWFWTNLTGCAPCKERRIKWNKLIPFKKNPNK